MCLFGYFAYLYITLPSYVRYVDRLAEDYWKVYLLFNTPKLYRPAPVFSVSLTNNCYKNRTRCPKVGSFSQRQQASAYAEYLGRQYGLPVGFMATMGWLESKHNPRAKFCRVKRGKRICYKNAAAGWYQYILSTSKGYGVGDKGRYDPVWSATRAAKDAKNRMRTLTKLTGVAISNENRSTVWLYLAHNQGDCGLGLIVQMAVKGKVDKWCTSRKKMFRNIYQNTHRHWKGKVRRQGTFNQVSARAYLSSMQETWLIKAKQVSKYR